MKLIVKTLCTILLMSISVAFVSCGNNQATISAEKYKELSNESILLIPDSLLNEEQAALKSKLVNLVYEEVEVVDNNLVLKMSREALEQQGIPSFYYDILQYQMKETTDTMKKWVEDGTLPIEHANLDSLFRKAKRRYLNLLSFNASIEDTNSVNPQQKGLKVTQETIDFGKLSSKELSELNIAFELKNITNIPISITKTDVSCGCLQVDEVKEPILPNSNFLLKVSIKSANQKGYFNKVIFVKTDYNKEVHLLRIKGELID